MSALQPPSGATCKVRIYPFAAAAVKVFLIPHRSVHIQGASLLLGQLPAASSEAPPHEEPQPSQARSLPLDVVIEAAGTVPNVFERPSEFNAEAISFLRRVSPRRS